MSKKNKKYIVEYDYTTEIELSEIDFDLHGELKIGDDDSNMGNMSSGETNSFWAGESFSINIDRVIKILNELKKKDKCKYVQIMYHVDHIGYVFNGLNITKHLEGSVSYNKCINKQIQNNSNNRKKKIKELQDELDKLKDIL